MNRLRALHAEQGQAIWLDFVARGFVRDGALARMVEADGLRGVTSNPAIFEKAIGHSDEYDEALALALAGSDRPLVELYEGLVVADIQAAADVLRGVYEASAGADGFVSLEVSPYLALDAAATVVEARRLWNAVGRANLMVKVPGTTAGLEALRTLTAEGISVNVTLLFSQAVYEAVAEAYLEGLEQHAAKGGDVARVASVASFFVSRIDTVVDGALDARIAAGETALGALRSKVAIANAKLAYQRYKRLFGGARFASLAARGARPQRLLWASTAVKDKALRDTLYVEALIGPDTVNTVPPATLDAFRDHGVVAATLEAELEEAASVMRRLDEAGIALEPITARLLDDGLALFHDAADRLLGAIAAKRSAILGARR